MPHFHRLSRITDFEDVRLMTHNNLVEPSRWKGTDAPAPALVRPHTSGGLSNKRPEVDLPPVPWLLRRHRFSISSSRSSNSLPIHNTTTDGVAKRQRLKSKSTTTLRLNTSTAKPQETNVGLAIGSPSQLFPHQDDSFGPAVQADLPEMKEPNPQDNADAHPQVVPIRPNHLKRWRTVSGLFTRKKQHSPIASPLGRASHEREDTNSKPEPRASMSRSSSYFSRKSRDSTPLRRAETRRDARAAALLTPTPGDARAVEAGHDASRPRLMTAIPSASFDRFSVMFSSFLAPKTESTAGAAVPEIAAVSQSEDRRISEPTMWPIDEGKQNTHVLHDPIYPQRTQSLAPRGPQYRASAVPAALFTMSKPESAVETDGDLPTRRDPKCVNTPQHMDAIQEFETPREDMEAWALCMSPTDPVFTSYSRRCSADSYSTNALPSPAFTTSSWCSSTTIRDSPSSPAVPFSKFPAPPGFSAIKTTESEHYLSIPSPSKRTSWDESIPSPVYAPPSASPRMKFGYDAPRSPLISVAQTVTVSLRNGQGHRPQLVVHDDNHSRQASYSDSAA